MKNLLLSAFLLFAITTYAQKSLMKFGEIDDKDLIMNSFEADTSAGALILGDIGTITVSPSTFLEVIYKRHLRVKVFNVNGFDLAIFKIPYYQSNQSLTKIKATSYNLEDGKTVETTLKKSDMYIEDLTSREQSLNFSVPNIKAGTVFEVEYTLTSRLMWQIRVWDFQYTVPARFSELSVSIPEYFIYKKLMNGYLSPSFNQTEKYMEYYQNGSQSIPYDGTIQIIRFDDVPAFKREPYMNAIRNYLSSIEYELGAVNFPRYRKDFSTSWEKISKELLQAEDFGFQLKRNCPMKEPAVALKTVSDEKERMIMAHKLVRDNMAFNSRNGIYVTTTLRKAWNEKTGNASDINLLLISLLNEVGIEAEPVLLSTRDNGILHPAQIMLSKFNYVIAEARIGDETFLLDATNKYLPYSTLPEECINGQGRRISRIEKRNDWVNLDQNKPTERVFFAQTKLDPSGNISGEFNLMETAHYAYKRSTLIRKEVKQDDYIAVFEAETPGLIIDDFTIENPDNLQNPLVIKYKGKLNVSDETPKDVLYINPLLGNGTSVNPFTLEERAFPVDFITPFTLKVINMIEIPAGYVVTEIPKSAVISLPDDLATFRYTIVIKDNQVQVNTTFLMKTAQITASYYTDLRKFYSMIVEKNAEMLVLKKI